ncbi:D-glycero-beta-D-manno-heptose 1-phosphate adenylyltransferase [candidate division KSB1 bacterium]|nr:D-glycero-beta-D-manno-heptose 1-phosphate adenylyltransferase [candidate division KSB1 bacterium]RQW08967.1 MAG: D-glycero-beta-D-manno-heptose 1-phosphate adenylyltransferase [candidate division KSB1 bacterium]
MTSKIKTAPQLQRIRRMAKKQKKRVVWTNGCYDILHAGHVLYLQRAKECGDILIVGLNSDNSIRATKGQLRPIVPEAERAIVISALACVDYVIIFDQDSPLDIIAALQPDIYAKGGDYTIDTINQAERRLVESYGGEIALLPGIAGNSTTAVINKILRAYRDESTS